MTDFNCPKCGERMKKALNKEAWGCRACEVSVVMTPLKDMEHIFPKVLEDKEIIGPTKFKAMCYYCNEYYQATELRGGVCQACIWKRKGEQNG